MLFTSYEKSKTLQSTFLSGHNLDASKIKGKFRLLIVA